MTQRKHVAGGKTVGKDDATMREHVSVKRMGYGSGEDELEVGEERREEEQRDDAVLCSMII